MFRDIRFLLVLGVAIGLWVPLARLGWFSSHESASYVIRTVEWAVELRAGALYPRWCPDFYGGYGSPFFVFHGPVVYGIAGLLHATMLDAFWSLKVVMLLASMLAGAGAYALVFGETRDPDAALLGGVAYLAAPYRIGDLTERGDLAEFTCIALLPVVAALYRASAREALPRQAQRLAVAASVVHAVLIMTHPVLGLWGTIVIGLIVLASVVRVAARRAYRRALLLVGAMICAPGLAAVYIVPALLYRGLVQTPMMVTSAYSPEENWIGWGTLFADSTPEFARNFLKIGPLLLVAFITALFGLARSPRRGWPAFAWMAFAATLVFLALPQGRAFWTSNHVPLTRFIQFPWRLLGPAALFASVALGIGSSAMGERVRDTFKLRIAIMGAGMLLFMVAWPYASAKEMATDRVPLDPENIRQGMLSTTSADEFLPREADRAPERPPGNVVASVDGAAMEHTSGQGSHHLLTLRAERDGANVGLALHGFPGWAVETALGPMGGKAELHTDNQGRLQLRLPVAGLYRLRLWFGAPRTAYVGAVLSMLTALVLGLVLVHGSRPWPWRAPAKVSSGDAS